eukprot:gb/GEZJ01001190.1/.p1 GENE.gb/GEZJ01001190.1/~~gb/GEZJ01001190.1/.p1  ORF type:complete len:378 (-),score=36.41 gb/GEZJ01001190.1/:185-1318(-)
MADTDGERAPLLLAWRRRQRRWGAKLLLAAAFCTTTASVALLAATQLAHNAHTSRASHLHATRPWRRAASVLVLGDWGRNGLHGQRGVARAMAVIVQRERAHSGNDSVHVISTGDNFYPSGVRSVRDAHFNASFETVYGDARLRNVPWWVTLGNHDHDGRVGAQVKYSARSTRWRLPAAYHAAWVTRHVRGVFLDTTTLLVHGHNSGQQTWLRNELLAQPRDTRFILVGHHNQFSASTSDHGGNSALRTILQRAMRGGHARRMLAYVSGHEHSLMHLRVRHEQQQQAHMEEHVVSGGGSKLSAVRAVPQAQRRRWRRCCGVLAAARDARDATRSHAAWAAAAHGVMVLRLRADALQLEAVDARARVLYRFSKRLPPL